MIKAAQDGDTEKIGNSLEKGADLNVRDDLNRTPLMIAATFGHSEVVQFLVDKGANHSDQSHYIEVAQGAIFMEQNMRFGLVLGRLSILKKNWWPIMSKFEAGFFMFSWAKKCYLKNKTI